MKKTSERGLKTQSKKGLFFEKHNNRARTRGRVIQEVKMAGGSRFIFHRYLEETN